jgi:tRNA A37 threonylcarbamoyladenosine modification protein TsaB
MRILFLDLASHSSSPAEGASIACATDIETAAIKFVDHRIGDDGLMPMLDEVLAEAAWTEKDLTNIACIVGPGGFTSLRMAVTLANTYGDQLRIPIAGIHLSDLYKHRSVNEDFIWMHATKKTHLFVRGFGSYASLWNEPTLLSIEELVRIYPEGAPYAGELLIEHKEALAQKKPIESALLSIADTLPMMLKDLGYTQQILEPWYGRGW